MNRRGRPLGIALENRKCKLCKNNIEKEYHVLLACPHFTDLSNKIKSFYSRLRTLIKFDELTSTTSKERLLPS